MAQLPDESPPAAAGLQADAGFRDLQNLLDRELDEVLSFPGQGVPERLAAALRHAVFPGGKRLRPMLCLLANRAVGGAVADALPAAVALELIHCYSLVHDDLPAMDDDAIRRGRPTVHVAFGEALAILAGDGLLTLALEHVASRSPPRCAAALTTEIARAAGVLGMVGGQADDVLAEGRLPPSLDVVRGIHERKTGSLIRASVRAGVLAAEGMEQYLEPADQLGRCLGLAFQIVDDLIGRSGDPKKAGKPVGKDDQRGKLTYPAVAGEEQARRMVADLTDQALLYARRFPHPTDLAALAVRLRERTS